MFKILVRSALGLIVAVAIPVIFFGAKDFWKGVGFGGATPAAGQPASNAAGATPAATPVTAPPAASTSPALEGAPVHGLGEVLRFDVSPDWIVSRWPRVSTGLAQLQLQGYRVPLVSGTAESDLAGALTYYFNAQQQLQRITFSGTTGDARGLVGLVSAQFHLTRRLTNDPGLMVYEAVQSDNKPASALKIRSASILKADEPYRRFNVEMVLERPEE